jgi:hypothetical protein
MTPHDQMSAFPPSYPPLQDDISERERERRKKRKVRKNETENDTDINCGQGEGDKRRCDIYIQKMMNRRTPFPAGPPVRHSLVSPTSCDTSYPSHPPFVHQITLTARNLISSHCRHHPARGSPASSLDDRHSKKKKKRKRKKEIKKSFSIQKIRK